jgi:DNA invertase Pin-like site-specific DNA recombinase
MQRTESSSATSPIAYSYVRFSTPDQLKGDSLRRQTDAAAAWCEKNGARLDTSTTFRDLGKSAFLGEHRKNPDRNALACFLKLVEGGKVPRGSFLIIEALDRLTREHVRAGLMLLLGLIEAGVRIVQLSPSELIYDEKSDEMGLMLAIVELSRGHRESKRKSDVVGEAWAEKKKDARNGTVLTRRIPAWVEERGGRLHLIPDRGAAVKRIFALAAGGYGLTSIVRTLIADKVPPFGDSGHWVRSYVGILLKDRRAVGELQPRLCGGRADGDPIPNYYPAAVTEEEWLAARAGAAERKTKRGRIGSHVNLFSGLLRHASPDAGCHGGTLFGLTRTEKRRQGPKVSHRVLMNSTGFEGRTASVSFPLEAFEEAVLSMLREIDPHEILNGDAGPDEALALRGRLERVESSIALIVADMDENGESPALFQRLRKKEAEKRDLDARLAEAQTKAANPLSASWGECKGLLETVASAPDPEDARLRLRSTLRRIIDSVWVLIVPRGRDRLAAVQVWFAGGKRCRGYVVLHRAAKANASARQAGGWAARSLSEVAAPGAMDLRNPEHTGKLADALAEADLSTLQS